MREILFRGKRSDNDLWIYGCLRQYPSGAAGICGREMIRTLQVYHETVGQYTGLTDKKGKRIFEGDVVKAYIGMNPGIPKAHGIVVFENGTFKLDVFAHETEEEFSFVADLRQTKEKQTAYAIENNFIFRGYSLEVIGNIHDNPELLNGGAEDDRQGT